MKWNFISKEKSSGTEYILKRNIIYWNNNFTWIYLKTNTIHQEKRITFERIWKRNSVEDDLTWIYFKKNISVIKETNGSE